MGYHSKKPHIERFSHLEGLDQFGIKQPLPERKVEIYKTLDWEPLAYRQKGKTEKALMTYDQSLKNLRKRGFQRPPYPSEVFLLLMDNLEGKVTDPIQQGVARDMLTSYGE